MNDVEDIARWYIIHAYSGHEERVKKNLEQRIETLDIKDKILEKSGYDHVFTVDGEGGADYNQIKSRVEMNSKR